MADPGQTPSLGSDDASFDAPPRVEISLGGAAPDSEADHTSSKPGESLRDLLLRFAGSCSGPADMSLRHDFYAHGTPDE